MGIGEVAAQAGVNVQTLRYYERRGLLLEPARAAQVTENTIPRLSGWCGLLGEPRSLDLPSERSRT